MIVDPGFRFFFRYTHRPASHYLRIRDTAHGCVLVSHSEAQIKRLYDRAVWIEKGEIVLEGDPEVVTKKYSEASR